MRSGGYAIIGYLDDERGVNFNPQRHPHLDHGYAVTSYSSQGQTDEVGAPLGDIGFHISAAYDAFRTAGITSHWVAAYE